MFWTEIAFWYESVALSALFGYIWIDRPFYDKLIKPNYTPSPRAISVIWIILFTLEATAAYLLQLHLKGGWSVGLDFFLVFLKVITFFPPVFFGYKQILLSCVIMIGSTALSIITNYFFFAKFWLPGLLFLPTTLWVSYATVLQILIWRYNPPSSPIQTPILPSSKRKNPPKYRLPQQPSFYV
jgi:translocator protein